MRKAASDRLYDESRAAYDAKASLYGIVDGVEQIDEALLDGFVARLDPQSTVLDLGAGPGQYAEVMAGRGHTVVAADNSIGMLRELRVRNRRPAVLPVQVDLRNLAFQRESFDAVWACAVLIHVEADLLDAVLSSIRDLCRPGAVLMVNFAISEMGLRFERLGASEYASGGRFFQHYPSARELLDKLKRSGFELLDERRRVVEPDLSDGRSKGRIEWASFYLSAC